MGQEFIYGMQDMTMDSMQDMTMETQEDNNDWNKPMPLVNWKKMLKYYFWTSLSFSSFSTKNIFIVTKDDNSVLFDVFIIFYL